MYTIFYWKIWFDTADNNTRQACLWSGLASPDSGSFLCRRCRSRVRFWPVRRLRRSSTLGRTRVRAAEMLLLFLREKSAQRIRSARYWFFNKHISGNFKVMILFFNSDCQRFTINSPKLVHGKRATCCLKGMEPDAAAAIRDTERRSSGRSAADPCLFWPESRSLQKCKNGSW